MICEFCRAGRCPQDCSERRLRPCSSSPGRRLGGDYQDRLEEILKKVAELVLDQPWQLFWQVSNGLQCLCNKAVVVVKAAQPDVGLGELAHRVGR